MAIAVAYSTYSYVASHGRDLIQLWSLTLTYLSDSLSLTTLFVAMGLTSAFMYMHKH